MKPIELPPNDFYRFGTCDGIPQADYMDTWSRDNSLESPRMEMQPNGYFPAAKWAALILMENGRKA